MALSCPCPHPPMERKHPAWLRKFYPPGSDEPHFDITPATEKAWLVTLGEREFVGGDTAVKERFTQFANLARELRADFREVAQTFRTLNRWVRERITLWAGSKGALLQDILGERDLIAGSDQGRSFRAFWDFLMSRSRQEELTELLERVFQLESVADMAPAPRFKRVYDDWLDAAMGPTEGGRCDTRALMFFQRRRSHQERRSCF